MSNDEHNESAAADESLKETARVMVWNFIRDRGKAGCTSASMIEGLRGTFAESTLHSTLSKLRRNGFVWFEDDRYYVDQNVRTPNGCQPLLPPALSEGMPWNGEQMVARPVMAKPVMALPVATPAVDMDAVHARRAEQRPLYARFDSDGILELECPQGTLRLEPQQTRRLFAFLDLMRGE